MDPTDWTYWAWDTNAPGPHGRTTCIAGGLNRLDPVTWHRDRFDPGRRVWVHLPGNDVHYGNRNTHDWYRLNPADAAALTRRLVAAASAGWCCSTRARSSVDAP